MSEANSSGTDQQVFYHSSFVPRVAAILVVIVISQIFTAITGRVIEIFGNIPPAIHLLLSVASMAILGLIAIRILRRLPASKPALCLSADGVFAPSVNSTSIPWQVIADIGLQRGYAYQHPNYILLSLREDMDAGERESLFSTNRPGMNGLSARIPANFLKGVGPDDLLRMFREYHQRFGKNDADKTRSLKAGEFDSIVWTGVVE